MKDPAARVRAAAARFLYASPVHALTLVGRAPREPVPGLRWITCFGCWRTDPAPLER